MALQPAAEVKHDYLCDGPAPGNLNFRWIYGSPIAARNRDPRIQVVAYNEDTYAMRENICVHWEGPFTYLLFGNHGAVLIDTGATAEPGYYPLRKTVDAIISRWATMRGKREVPLTIVMTSGEDVAQNQGTSQFTGCPNTRRTPLTLNAMKQFHALDGWPEGVGTIDLGDRVVKVIPTPGAHKDGLSFLRSLLRLPLYRRPGISQKYSDRQ